MRISDWSSDVCSSDLSVLRARLVRAFAGEEVARQPLDDAPLLRAGVLRLVDQQVIEATVELEQHPGDAAVAREQTVGIVNEVVVVEQNTRLLVALVGFQNRSEEHTSELQSLMRISYAVFCLKKKTNKNEKT